MAAKQIVGKSAFARMAGVSPAAITKACGRQLLEAVTGKYIDAAHPSAVEYLGSKVHGATKKKTTKKKATKAKPTKAKPKAKPKPTKKKSSNAMDFVPSNIREYADMSLRELVNMFGTDVGFKAWLDASVKIEELKTKQIKNAVELKDLIKWDLVERAFIVPVNELFVKLLTDCVDSVTSQCMTAAKAGDTKEACEKQVREKIESFLLQLKKQWKRNRENYV